MHVLPLSGSRSLVPAIATPRHVTSQPSAAASCKLVPALLHCPLTCIVIALHSTHRWIPPRLFHTPAVLSLIQENFRLLPMSAVAVVRMPAMAAGRAVAASGTPVARVAASLRTRTLRAAAAPRCGSVCAQVYGEQFYLI
jgi:hypothetical protein